MLRWGKSRDLYNIVPVMNNMVLCTWKFLRADLMLCSYHTHTHTKEKNERDKETLEGVRYVYYLDCGDVIRLFAHIITHQIVYVQCCTSWLINYTSIKLLKKVYLKWTDTHIQTYTFIICILYLIYLYNVSAKKKLALLIPVSYSILTTLS